MKDSNSYTGGINSIQSGTIFIDKGSGQIYPPHHQSGGQVSNQQLSVNTSQLSNGTQIEGKAASVNWFMGDSWSNLTMDFSGSNNSFPLVVMSITFAAIVLGIFYFDSVPAWSKIVTLPFVWPAYIWGFNKRGGGKECH